MENVKSEGKPAVVAELVPASDARDRLTELMNRARYGGERFILTRNGEPFVAIIGAPDLDQLLATAVA